MGACASCGAENAEQARFCSSCGAPLMAPGAAVRKTVSVLFCDVVGSTSLGESTDPEVLRATLARYFERMKSIVEQHGGTVEKFIGDAVMAVFGLPVAHEDDALRAIHSAVQMLAQMPELGIEVRIGVTSGEVVAGTAERLATGDAVNVAARLEQAAGPGQILCSDAALRLAGNSVQAEPVPPLVLKGKAQPVAAWRVRSVDAIPAPRAPSDSPLVGRSRELQTLHDTWRGVVDTNGCETVTVVAPAGVGKSRLVGEFLAEAEVTPVRGRCLPYGDGITYWPVVGFVKQLDDYRSALEPIAARALDVLLGGTGATTSDDIAWAVRRLLEAAAAQQPRVVVFDDIQWGEDPFLDLLEHLAVMTAAPVLLVCMARPELLEKRPDWVGVLRLELLSEDDAKQLLETRLGGLALDSSVRDRILSTAAGNPLFVEEMAAVLGTAEAAAEITVPPTIQALLTARLDQLDEAERAVLEHGAIEGEVFHRGAVHELTPGEPRLTARLTSLVRRELVRPERSLLAADDAYRFRHLLVRDAAYESIPKSRRAELHERLGSWLEEAAVDLVELDEIAGYHFEEAHRYRAELGFGDDMVGVRGAGHLAGAGRRAMSHGDIGGAIKLFTRARALLPAPDDDIELTLHLTDALFFAGRLDEGHELALKAEEAAAARGDRRAEQLARIQRVTFEYWQGRAAAEAVFDACREAIPIFEAVGDDRGLMRAWGEIGGAANQRSTREAGAAIERALHYGERVGDEAHYVQTLETMLGSSYSTGPTPLPQFLDWIAARDNPNLVRGRATAEAGLGNFATARQVLDEAMDRAESLGDRFGIGANAQARASVESMAGDQEAELFWQRRSCAVFTEMEHNGWLPSGAARLSLLLSRAGDLDEAEQWADRATELAGPDDFDAQQITRMARALLLTRRSQPVEAVRLADEAVAMVRDADVFHLLQEALRWYAEVLVAAGDDGRPALEEAMLLAQEKGNLSRVDRLRERLAELSAASVSE